jgi:hypothetical protein
VTLKVVVIEAPGESEGTTKLGGENVTPEIGDPNMKVVGAVGPSAVDGEPRRTLFDNEISEWLRRHPLSWRNRIIGTGAALTTWLKGNDVDAA